MQLYRMLWIYIAVHDLGRASAARGTSKAWNPAYRKAAIRIAQELTPLLVAGGELDIEQVEAGKIISHCQSIEKVHCGADGGFPAAAPMQSQN